MTPPGTSHSKPLQLQVASLPGAAIHFRQTGLGKRDSIQGNEEAGI
jgi:hypothetical protein